MLEMKYWERKSGKSRKSGKLDSLDVRKSENKFDPSISHLKSIISNLLPILAL